MIAAITWLEQTGRQQKVLTRSWRGSHTGFDKVTHATNTQQVTDKGITLTGIGGSAGAQAMADFLSQ